MRPIPLRSLLASSAATLAFASLAAPPPARAVSCGDVLVEDTVLDRDLDCPGDGLIAGADAITIDLGGHQLKGPGEAYSFVPGSAGVRIEGRRGVVVGRGTITGFETGVLLIQGARQNTVRTLELEENETPIVLEDARGNRVEANHAPPCDHDESGIRLVRSDRNTVVANDTTGRWGTSMMLEDSHWNVVSNNRVSTNGQPLVLIGSHWNALRGNSGHGAFAPGLVLRASHHNRIMHNQLSGDYAAIGLDDSHHNRLVDNQLRSWDELGILLQDSTHNHILGNRIQADIGEGVLLLRADRSRVLFNEIDAEENYSGIDVRDSSRVTLKRNVVSGGADGISVDASSERVRIVENLVSDNEDDGIDASGRRVVLRGNTAIDNGDYGIVAAPGVIDAGGNLAYGNGNPEQCLNVSCE